jgi:hypothetical protein
MGFRNPLKIRLCSVFMLEWSSNPVVSVMSRFVLLDVARECSCLWDYAPSRQYTVYRNHCFEGFKNVIGYHTFPKNYSPLTPSNIYIYTYTHTYIHT